MRPNTLILTLLLYVQALLATPSFVNFTTDNGLPSNDVHAIHYHSDSTIWIATTEGVAQYRDGLWKTFEISNDTTDTLSNIISFVTGTDDALYFMGNRSLYKFENEQWQCLIDGLDYFIWGRVYALDSAIYFFSSDNVWCPHEMVEFKDGELTRYGHEFSSHQLTDFLPESDSSVIIPSIMGPQYRYCNGTFEESGLRDLEVGTVLAAYDPDGDLWTYSLMIGICHYHDNTLDTVTTDMGLICDSTINTLLIDQSHVWIASDDKGIQVISGGTDLSDYNIGNSDILSDSVRAMTIERPGVLWAATNQGVSQIIYDASAQLHSKKAKSANSLLFSHNGMHITLPSNVKGEGTIGLYTMQGKRIESRAVTFQANDPLFSSVAQGMYLIKVTWEGGSLVEKLCIP